MKERKKACWHKYLCVGFEFLALNFYYWPAATQLYQLAFECRKCKRWQTLGSFGINCHNRDEALEINNSFKGLKKSKARLLIDEKESLWQQSHKHEWVGGGYMKKLREKVNNQHNEGLS